MKDNISDVERRVRGYWYVDGFGELVGGGGICLLLAVYFAAQEYFGDDSWVGGLLQVSLVLVMLGGMFIVRRLIGAAKLRREESPLSKALLRRNRPSAELNAEKSMVGE